MLLFFFTTPHCLITHYCIRILNKGINRTVYISVKNSAFCFLFTIRVDKDATTIVFVMLIIKDVYLQLCHSLSKQIRQTRGVKKIHIVVTTGTQYNK